MRSKDASRITPEMSRKSSFPRATPDAADPKHSGAKDIRFQNHSFVVQPNHSDGREVEVPEISCLQFFRLDAALFQFFVLDFQFRAINPKLVESVS